MALENAKEYLKKFNKENDIIVMNESLFTVADAANALGVSNNEIAKSLSFDLGNKYILVIFAGDYKVDNHKFKEKFGVKPRMVDKEILNEIIGHEAGGICPFGIKDNIDVYLDESLKQFKYVFPACGSSNSAIKLTLDELYSLSNSKGFVDVGKEKNYEE